LYVPAETPDNVILVPEPDIEPGFTVQVPEGKLLNAMVPVAIEHVGCVIVPTTGAEGVAAIKVILVVAKEVQPSVFVTVKLYVPATRPESVVLGPEPDIAPGLIVQFPDGKPLNATLPVATAQVGCVIVPTIGADGVTG
jgi:hypothetical protein